MLSRPSAMGSALAAPGAGLTALSLPAGAAPPTIAQYDAGRRGRPALPVSSQR